MTPSRRDILRAAAGVGTVAASGAAFQTISASVDDGAHLYARQGSNLYRLDPFELGEGTVQRVDSFYSYDGTPRTGLEQRRVSNLGVVTVGSEQYLFVTHGKPERQQTNGRVTMTFDGLADAIGAEPWVVTDDEDDFDRAGTNRPEKIEWQWSRGQSDGGAAGSFDAAEVLDSESGIGEDEIEITPEFACGITEWHAVSGPSKDDPGRRRLDYDEPVYIGATEDAVLDVEACYGGPGDERAPPQSGGAVYVTVRGDSLDDLQGFEFGGADDPAIERFEDRLELTFEASDLEFVNGRGAAGVGQVVGETAELTASFASGEPALGRATIERCVNDGGVGTLVVEQGDLTVPLEPLADAETAVKEFYDYRNYRPENDGLTETGAMRVVPYHGADGLSLVLTFGAPLDGSSGALTLDVDSDDGGLPEGASWVLVDDCSDLDRPESNPPETIRWQWDRVADGVGENLPIGPRNPGDQADGGVIRGGLDSAFELEFDPDIDYGLDGIELLAPVEDALESASDSAPPAEITDGSVSLGGDSLDVVPLSLDEPFTIRRADGDVDVSVPREEDDGNESWFARARYGDADGRGAWELSVGESVTPDSMDTGQYDWENGDGTEGFSLTYDPDGTAIWEAPDGPKLEHTVPEPTGGIVVELKLPDEADADIDGEIVEIGGREVENEFELELELESDDTERTRKRMRVDPDGDLSEGFRIEEIEIEFEWEGETANELPSANIYVETGGSTLPVDSTDEDED